MWAPKSVLNEYLLGDEGTYQIGASELATKSNKSKLCHGSGAILSSLTQSHELFKVLGEPQCIYIYI